MGKETLIVWPLDVGLTPWEKRGYANQYNTDLSHQDLEEITHEAIALWIEGKF
jgi:hypothetical protein